VNRSILALLVCFIVAVPSSARRKTAAEDTCVVKVRGVMERFQNISEGLDRRLDIIAEAGMTHYFYAPSDDRYCNAWGWKFLYNDSERHALKSLKKKCDDRNLEFVWTVSPGEGYRWNDEDYKFLLNKLLMMYYDGVRSFAVHFHGTKGDYASIRSRLDVDFVSTRKQRPSLYIVNEIPQASFPDGNDAALTIMRGYHFDDDFRKSSISTGTIMCVLHERSELAKIALTAVADCARDPDTYDSDLSMARGVETLSPGLKEPFTTFLTHTGGVHESENVETFSLAGWSRGKTEALLSEFEKIESVPEKMSACQSPELLKSLDPWMREFGRLGTRGKRTIECLNHYIDGNVGEFWLAYVGNQMSEEEISSYRMYNVGCRKLHPFYVNMMQELTEAFTVKLTGGKTLKNLASTLYAAPNAALDSDFTTYMPSSGHVEFPIPADANACRLLTGELPEGKMILFRQLGTDGSLIAEFIVKSPYSEFDLKEGAVKVDVLGDVDIYESIFVYL